ncbi:MAG: hypothetical protein ACPL7G_10435 [Chloroflexia bacterium]
MVEFRPEKAEALSHLLENFYAPDFAIREAAERRGHFNVMGLADLLADIRRQAILG